MCQKKKFYRTRIFGNFVYICGMEIQYNIFKDITKDTNNQCVCENPRLIINPLLPELLAKYGKYFLRGNYFEFPFYSCVKLRYKFPWHIFSIYKYDKALNKRVQYVTEDDIPNSYVIDDETGETFPIYMLVPCNHCAICREKKAHAFVQRCQLESLQYDSLPWFVTLTYREKPLNNELNKRDVQLFLKRLRINLERAGYKDKIRYVAVGEYGKNTKRPHYHLLIWNINAFTHKQFVEVSDIINKSWNLGFIQHRLVDCKDDKSFYYTAKYLRKTSNLSDDDERTPPFMCSSNRGGGIGCPYLMKLAPAIRKSMAVNFKFFDKFRGAACPLFFTSYVLKKVFPSWSTSVPAVLRQALADYALAYSNYCFLGNLAIYGDIFKEQIEKKHKEIMKKHSPYCFCLVGDGDNVYTLYDNDAQSVRDKLFDCMSVIDKFSDIDYDAAVDLHAKRQQFCGKLFRNIEPVDISERAYRAKTNIERAAAREML